MCWDVTNALTCHPCEKVRALRGGRRSRFRECCQCVARVGRGAPVIAANGACTSEREMRDAERVWIAFRPFDTQCTLEHAYGLGGLPDGERRTHANQRIEHRGMLGAERLLDHG